MNLKETVTALLTARYAQGIDQRELAYRMGKTQPHISRLERLEMIPTVATLSGWANALGYDLDIRLRRQENEQ